MTLNGHDLIELEGNNEKILEITPNLETIFCLDTTDLYKYIGTLARRVFLQLLESILMTLGHPAK
jgi:hypothetical protein